MIGTQPASEIHPPRGAAIDVDYVQRFSQAHQRAGFDRIIIGYFSNRADGFIVASYAAFVRERLGLMLAYRPGFVAPTLAARKLATVQRRQADRFYSTCYHVAPACPIQLPRRGLVQCPLCYIETEVEGQVK